MMPRRMGVALNAISQAKSIRTIAIFRLGGWGNLFSAYPNQENWQMHTGCKASGIYAPYLLYI